MEGWWRGGEVVGWRGAEGGGKGEEEDGHGWEERGRAMNARMPKGVPPRTHSMARGGGWMRVDAFGGYAGGGWMRVEGGAGGGGVAGGCGWMDGAGGCGAREECRDDARAPQVAPLAQMQVAKLRLEVPPAEGGRRERERERGE